MFFWIYVFCIVIMKNLKDNIQTVLKYSRNAKLGIPIHSEAVSFFKKTKRISRQVKTNQPIFCR